MTEERNVPMARAEAEEQAHTPSVDIYETNEGLVLLVDLPGAAEDGVDVSVEADVLSVEARVKRTAPEGAAVVLREFEPRLYRRTFALSRDIDRDAIKGKVTNGVLHVDLPKAAQSKVRKIAIKSADAAP